MIDINNSANSSPLVRALETHIRALGLPDPGDGREFRYRMVLA